jgi:hypothetical protein
LLLCVNDFLLPQEPVGPVQLRQAGAKHGDYCTSQDLETRISGGDGIGYYDMEQLTNVICSHNCQEAKNVDFAIASSPTAERFRTTDAISERRDNPLDMSSCAGDPQASKQRIWIAARTRSLRKSRTGPMLADDLTTQYPRWSTRTVYDLAT